MGAYRSSKAYRTSQPYRGVVPVTAPLNGVGRDTAQPAIASSQSSQSQTAPPPCPARPLSP